MIDWEPLVKAALDAREHAYAPYSGYRVGAALLVEGGELFYVGCNVENASYPVGTCAERVALGAAIADGHQRFEALVIATRGPEPGTPCGMCRQALSEFAPSLPVLLVTPEDNRATWSLADLLPGSFGPAQLVRKK